MPRRNCNGRPLRQLYGRDWHRARRLELELLELVLSDAGSTIDRVHTADRRIGEARDDTPDLAATPGRSTHADGARDR